MRVWEVTAHKQVHPKVCADPLKRPCANNKVVYNYWAKMRCCDMNTDIKDSTRWREDMNFMSEWQEQYTSRT